VPFVCCYTPFVEARCWVATFVPFVNEGFAGGTRVASCPKVEMSDRKSRLCWYWCAVVCLGY
jgi:hypothetical protein